MPVYNAIKPTPTLYIGDQYIVSKASTTTAVLLQQVAIAQQPGNPANVTVINKSSANLTVKVSGDDSSSGSYVPLTGGTVAANTALSFSTTAPFMALLPDADPGTGVIMVCR